MSKNQVIAFYEMVQGQVSANDDWHQHEHGPRREHVERSRPIEYLKHAKERSSDTEYEKDQVGGSLRGSTSGHRHGGVSFEQLAEQVAEQFARSKNAGWRCEMNFKMESPEGGQRHRRHEWAAGVMRGAIAGSCLYSMFASNVGLRGIFIDGLAVQWYFYIDGLAVQWYFY